MSFCRECGSKIEPSFTFCPECGTPQEQSEQAVNQVETQNAGPGPVHEPTPVPTPVTVTELAPEPAPALGHAPGHAPIATSPPAQPQEEVAIDWKQGTSSFVSFLKRYKALFIAILGIVIIAGGLYAVGAYITDGEHIITKFEQAAKDGDAAALASILKSNDSKLVLDEDNIKPLVDYLKNDHFSRESIGAELREQLKQYDKNMNYADVSDIYYKSIIHLQKDGKRFLLFDDYNLQVIALYPDVTTNYKGTKIKVNGKDMLTTNEEYYYDKVGPVVPGKNVFQATFEGDFSKMEVKKTVTLTTANSFESIELDLDGDYLTLVSDFDDASVFIDNKDTNLTVDEFDSIGPFLVDGSSEVHIEKEFPWGVVKSEAIPIDDSFIRVDLDPMNEDLLESIQMSTRNFYLEFVHAMNTSDVSMATHMSQEIKDAMIYAVDGFFGEESNFEVKLVKLVFDMNSIDYYDYEWSNNKFEVNIDVQAHLRITYLVPGETQEQYEDTTEAANCTLSYENGQWIVTDYYEIFLFDEANTEDVLL